MLTIPGALAWASFCVAVHKKNQIQQVLEEKTNLLLNSFENER